MSASSVVNWTAHVIENWKQSIQTKPPGGSTYRHKREAFLGSARLKSKTGAVHYIQFK